MAINIKAQASKLFTGIKETPVAKGMKDIFYVDGLFSNAQKEALEGINQRAKNVVNLNDVSLEKIDVGGIEIGGNDSKLRSAIRDKMKNIDEVGLGGIKDEATNGFIKNRATNNPDIKQLQEETIMNYAKSSIRGPKGNLSTEDLITNAAMSVDGQLAVMTPFNAAKEYYGSPVVNTINHAKDGDWHEALKTAGVAGARIGASAAAVGGAGMLVNGAVKGVGSGIRTLTGNNYER